MITTIKVNDNPLDVSTSQHIACVTNEGSNTVSTVIGGFHAATTIPVGSGPRGVAVSPDDKRVYVTNSGSGTASVIDTSTRKVFATSPVGSGPRGVAVSPDNKRVYVTNTSSDTVSVIDTSTNTVIDTIPVGSFPQGVAVSADGSFLYVTNGASNTVSAITLL